MAALLWLVARDSADLRSGLFLFAGAAFGIVGFLLVDVVGAVLPTGTWTAARYRRIAALVVCAPLLVLAALIVGGSSAARAPEVLAMALAVAAGATVAIERVAPRLGAPETARFWLAAVVAGVQLMGLFVYVHVAEGTLMVIRSNSERLHQLLFFGTWVVSLGLVIPWASRIAGRAGAEGRTPWGWAALSGLSGVVALELDRRQMIGLYPAVHLWLEWIGVLSLDAALGLGLTAAATGTRGGAMLRRLGVAALSLTVIAAAGFVTVALAGLVTDRAFRAAIAETAVGPALLRLARGEAERVEQVSIEHERYHDVPPPDNDWNIILISIDALRGDAIPDPDEEDKSRAPRLAELASTCADFRRAYAPGSRTMIGMGALMVGQYSAHIEWEMWLWDGKLIRPDSPEAQAARPDADYTTTPKIPPGGNLAQRLKAAGLRTMAMPWDSYSKFFRKGAGFEVGFDEYVDVGQFNWREPAASEVFEIALKQIDDARGQRFFQWIHLFDPHESKGDRERYAELVREMDAAIGDFLGELKRRKLRDRTALVILADHGEALGEHGNRTHATSLYEEQIHVPLLICLPKRPGKVMRRPVSTLDATATILALAGAELDGIDGVNLLPWIEDGRYPERRPVFTELHRYRSTKGERTIDMQAVIVDDWKLIRDVKADTLRLYDLARDPDETENLLPHEPARAAELEGMLDALVATRPETKPPPPRFSARPAAFEVTDSAALLWTRVSKPARVQFEISTRADFTDSRRTDPVEVDAERDHVLVADVTGLKPATRYHYRPVLLHEEQRIVGETGTFMTAAREPRAVRIAWGADLMGHEGPFRIFSAIRRQRPDVFLMLGDTMYADIPKENSAKDLKGYRARHWEVRRDKFLQQFLASTATAAIWDDHEIWNNSHSRSKNIDVARRVFQEHWPVRSADSQGKGLYRAIRPAPQVEVFILDLRSYRDPPKARTTMLGDAQKEWLFSSLAASTAKVKVVASSVPLLVPFGDDTWYGFPEERDELVARLAAENAIVLSGDFHMAWHLEDPATGLDEFIAGPLGAWTFKQMKPERLPEVEGVGHFVRYDALTFGVLDVSAEGAATVRFFDARGGELYRAEIGAEPKPKQEAAAKESPAAPTKRPPVTRGSGPLPQ